MTLVTVGKVVTIVTVVTVVTVVTIVTVVTVVIEVTKKYRWKKCSDEEFFLMNKISVKTLGIEKVFNMQKKS